MRQACTLLAVGLTAVLLSGCAAYSVKKCGSSSILVANQPEKLFPVYAKTFEVSFALTQVGKDSLKKATVNTTIGTQVRALYDTLDVINADVRNLLVTAYMRYALEMCAAGSDAERAKSAGQSFNETQRLILDYAVRVREIGAALDRAKAQKSDLDEAFNLAASLRGDVAKARSALAGT